MVQALGIRSDLEDLFVELGMGNFATHPQVLYPELVRQFMATVNVYYANERAKKASEGVLTFFICGIRYRVPHLTLCTIHGFETERHHAIIPDFPGIGTFWSHIATGFFDATKTFQSDIRHPTLRYFMKVLANTLLCRMEPSKVRVQELTLVYYTVRSLVQMEGIEEPTDDSWPNLGAIFAEHLAKLKMKPFQSTGKKRETVGSLLTPIFVHCGVPLDDADMDGRIVYMDAAHLTNSQWLKDDRNRCFRDETTYTWLGSNFSHLRTSPMDLAAFSSDLTLAESERQQPSRAATRSSDHEDLSRISPRPHSRHSRLCQTCLHAPREISSAS